jgi:hypothetical protein
MKSVASSNPAGKSSRAHLQGTLGSKHGVSSQQQFTFIAGTPDDLNSGTPDSTNCTGTMDTPRQWPTSSSLLRSLG